MESLKILIEAVLDTVFLLALIVLITALPEVLNWLSEQIGYITTTAILVGIIYIIATHK